MAKRLSPHRPIDWDDFRYVLALADSGSLNDAASALRVNRTTVLRRINAFERKHGVRLFERLRTGYLLTEAGNELLAAARGFESALMQIERRLAGQDLRAEGLVRVTTTDTLLASVLQAPLATFQRQHPGITLDVATSNEIANLSKRDADIAIRPVAEAPEFLVGRRIGAVAFAVYAAATAEEPRSTVKAPGDRWLGPDETLASTSVARWMRSEMPSVRPEIRADSLVSLRELCAAGAGLAALPCYLGDSDARLTRIRPPIPAMTTALWILTHPNLARTTRVRLLMDHLSTELGRQRPLLEGQRPRM
ncbi:LysR family transcriptional regulator [Peristeroidobacter agariperforans]|uniref:LysR family transcriptional regulator n=1 Tax=Peristeroidobacter agariperforans TaxID=268404 RepID=UPI00101D8ABF|nr:LysR family transcriptional regulator [Peristeroidobacter agariperforans]